MRARRGDPVVKILDAKDPNEVAVVGILRVESSREQLVERFRDIESFKQSPNVLQIGRFSEPPRIADLQNLPIDSGDIDDLRACRVGDCGVKMSARAIARLQREVDWSAPEYRGRVSDFVRRMLLESVISYVEGGIAALGDYADQEEPLRLAQEFDAILEASPYLAEHAPAFHRYLAGYPEVPLRGSEDFFYWSNEKLGLKSVISVTHVTIYTPPPHAGSDLLVASKQIYASHYFEASLGLAALVRERGEEGAAYLVYLNRSRLDALGGSWSGLRRKIIENRLKHGTETNLVATRQRLRKPRDSR
ncbi:MAG: hypothetical protein P8Y29_06450 [Gemmatimonadota bacterium]